MTRRPRKKAAPPALTDSDAAAWLRAHPDFFERFPHLLADMELPHRPGSPAVSLVKRQVAVLRRRNEELHAQLQDLLAIARENHELEGKIHRLAVSLIAASGVEQRLRLLRTRLRDEFKVERAVLIVFAAPSPVPADSPFLEGFLKVVDRRDAGLEPFASFLDAGTARCIRLRGGHRRLAFGAADAKFRSAALIPLGPRTELGFMVFASRDADHFHPGKRTDYLDKLGEAAAAALADRGDASGAGDGDSGDAVATADADSTASAAGCAVSDADGGDSDAGGAVSDVGGVAPGAGCDPEQVLET